MDVFGLLGGPVGPRWSSTPCRSARHWPTTRTSRRTADTVLAVRGMGPCACRAMPEAGNLPLPRKALEVGVNETSAWLRPPKPLLGRPSPQPVVLACGRWNGSPPTPEAPRRSWLRWRQGRNAEAVPRPRSRRPCCAFRCRRPGRQWFPPAASAWLPHPSGSPPLRRKGGGALTSNSEGAPCVASSRRSTPHAGTTVGRRGRRASEVASARDHDRGHCTGAGRTPGSRLMPPSSILEGVPTWQCAAPRCSIRSQARSSR
ncbi:hypothetical protein EES39_28145 [Streptomyces sp. ADI92-24]|nr:hypothetical protein EES39_28145 [Streptomyces sp. ADI92-24]